MYSEMSTNVLKSEHIKNNECFKHTIVGFKHTEYYVD